MKAHAVLGLGHSQIKIRETSCYCEKCLAGDLCNTWKTERMRSSPSNESSAPELETDPVASVSANIPNKTVVQFRVDQYVAAVYESNWYVGKIVDVDEEESDIEITFMEKRKKFYQWPRQQDKIWVKTDDILCSLAVPLATGKSNTMFKLHDNDEELMLALFDAHTQ